MTAAESGDDALMLAVFQADQKDRESVYHTPEALASLKGRDHERTRQAYELLRAGRLKTPSDLYHAAVVLQHGSVPSDFLTAHRLAFLSALMGHKTSRWLTAATLDRYLMSLGVGQVYGTQFELDPKEGKYQLKLPIQEQAILPFEKEFLGVPAAAERLKALNEQIRS